MLKERWWRRGGLNSRPPRCERGALPAELLPHLRAGKHFRRFPPGLSMRAPGAASAASPPRAGSVRGSPCDEPARLRFTSLRPPPAATSDGKHPFCCGASSRARARESFRNDKVFLRAADQCIEHVPGYGGTTLLTRWRRKKYLPWRKQIGGNNVKMRSPLRMESPPRPLRDPSRAYARESTPGKGSRRARLPRTAISSSRKGRFSGIANRPHVIRGRRVNIKKVHGIRHFPVDTVNAIF